MGGDLQTNGMADKVVSCAIAAGCKAIGHAADSIPAGACILLATVLPFCAPVLPAGGSALPKYLGGLEKRSECFNAMGDSLAAIGDAPADG